MLTRRSIYESHGFTCSPSYHSFDKEITEAEGLELSKILDQHVNKEFLNELFALKKKRNLKYTN